MRVTSTLKQEKANKTRNKQTTRADARTNRHEGHVYLIAGAEN